MSIGRDDGRLDFSGLSDIDARNVQNAITRSGNFQGYTPLEALGFIVRNCLELARLRSLDPAASK